MDGLGAFYAAKSGWLFRRAKGRGVNKEVLVGVQSEGDGPRHTVLRDQNRFLRPPSP